MLKNAEKDRPEILERPIERPIFITGMPRSGTTFLHHLLAQDPANRVVRCWETIYPYPSRARRQASPESRSAKVDRQLNGFARLVPEVRSLHPMTADAPQECTEINAHLFTSLRFDTTHRVPSYRRWLDSTGHLAAYRFHSRFLKHMQHKRPGRWVLKSPDHVFALDAIRQVYPDACFVFLHRSPLEVLPSVAKLTEVLRSPFTRHVDRHDIGGQVSEQWARGAAILLKEAMSGDPRCMHVRFDTFIRNPLGTVSEIYRQFGLTASADGAERFRKFAAQWPQGRKERHKAQLEQYGLAVGTERRRYQDYMAFFGL
jgi:Sulfotransferase family